MDSFGLDFSGGDLLDLGSIGMWGGNSTPIGSSPNGSTLPFSIGTPTGVQSLGDDAFANLPAGNDDFSFDSPKAANSNSANKTETSGNSNDGLSNAFFGAELESNKKASTVDAKVEARTKKEKKEVKPSVAACKPNASAAPNTTTASSAASSAATENTSFQAFLMGDAPPPNTMTSAKTSTTTTKTESGSAVSSAPVSNVSSARPHIDSSTSATAVPANSAANALSQQAQQQQRFQAQMGMNPSQPGFQPQGFPMNHQPGAQVMPQGQAPNAAQGRTPSFNYEEEFMRLKTIMQSHPDLIPPPSDVLRIAMAQSAASGNFAQQRPGPQMANRPGTNPAFNQFGGQAPNSNMMMQQPGQSPMDAARMQAMQAQMRQQQMRQGTQMAQGRTTPGSGDTQTAWQSENDLPLRRKMIGKIVSLLQQRKPDAPTEWIRRLPDMARRLEDSLYRTAKNRDEYGDFTSLKTRLQHLAVTMGARAQHKGGNPRAPGMIPNTAPVMVPGAVPPQGMAMNPGMAPGGVMNPQAQMMNNMQYANMAGRMTPQQLQMQHLQMQMQNPQMRQQLTPQQIQQLQQAQMQQRRQAYQQMQQQHAQLQRQNSMQQQQFQQNQAQAQLQRQNSMRQQQQQQMQQSAQQQQQHQQLQRRASMSGASGASANRMSGDMSLGVQGGLGDPNDFLNLDLSGSLLGDDLGLDMLGASDPLKAPDQVTGLKRSMSQNQQQLKRAKVGGGGTSQSGQNNGSQMSAVNAK